MSSATSVLLRSYYAFVLAILKYCSPVRGSAAECHLQLLERQVYSVASWSDQTFLSLCHWRHVVALCMLYKVNSNSNCSVSFHLLLQSSTYPSCICSSSIRVWSIKVYNVPICKVFSAGPDSCVEWPSLYILFYIGTLDGLIIIIIKISDASPSGKNITFTKLQSNPTSTCATEKKKADAKEADYD